MVTGPPEPPVTGGDRDALREALAELLQRRVIGDTHGMTLTREQGDRRYWRGVADDVLAAAAAVSDRAAPTEPGWPVSDAEAYPELKGLAAPTEGAGERSWQGTWDEIAVQAIELVGEQDAELADLRAERDALRDTVRRAIADALETVDHPGSTEDDCAVCQFAALVATALVPPSPGEPR